MDSFVEDILDEMSLSVSQKNLHEGLVLLHVAENRLNIEFPGYFEDMNCILKKKLICDGGDVTHEDVFFTGEVPVERVSADSCMGDDFHDADLSKVFLFQKIQEGRYDAGNDFLVEFTLLLHGTPLILLFHFQACPLNDGTNVP